MEYVQEKMLTLPDLIFSEVQDGFTEIISRLSNERNVLIEYN
jgi:hypothetical protein